MSDNMSEGQKNLLRIANAMFPQTRHLPDWVLLGRAPQDMTPEQQADSEVFCRRIRCIQADVLKKHRARLKLIRIWERLEALKKEKP